MLANTAYSFTPTEALRSTSFSAGANNGPWLPVSAVEGMLVFNYNVGAITGSVIFSLEDATDGSGTGAAALSPTVATASLSTAGGTGALRVDKRKIRSHVRVVATVTTGPGLLSCILTAQNKAAS
jgi:hypothetical protein